jgi:hypothetical protein
MDFSKDIRDAIDATTTDLERKERLESLDSLLRRLEELKNYIDTYDDPIESIQKLSYSVNLLIDQVKDQATLITSIIDVLVERHKRERP